MYDILYHVCYLFYVTTTQYSHYIYLYIHILCLVLYIFPQPQTQLPKKYYLESTPNLLTII